MQTDSTRPPFWIPNETIPVRDLSNKEFLERFARAGRIGLSTGGAPADGTSPRPPRTTAEGLWGIWTHAFIFEGTRVDGNHWVIESDLRFQEKQIQLGAQEHRMDYYYDQRRYPALAVLDFGLSQEHTLRLIREALEQVATKSCSTLRELTGMFAAMKNPALRGRESLLARDPSFFCSAFVAQLFRKIGMDVVPGLTVKHTAPEDIARSSAPHSTYLLQRGLPPAKPTAGRKKAPSKVEAPEDRVSPRIIVLNAPARPATRK